MEEKRRNIYNFFFVDNNSKFIYMNINITNEN